MKRAVFKRLVFFSLLYFSIPLWAQEDAAGGESRVKDYVPSPWSFSYFNLSSIGQNDYIQGTV